MTTNVRCSIMNMHTQQENTQIRLVLEPSNTSLKFLSKVTTIMLLTIMYQAL